MERGRVGACGQREEFTPASLCASYQPRFDP